jgi:hypothetical protein
MCYWNFQLMLVTRLGVYRKTQSCYGSIVSPILFYKIRKSCYSWINVICWGVSVSTGQGSLAHLYRLAKLAAGAKFSNSVVSYGQRPNNYESITTCACHLCGVMRCYEPLDSSTYFHRSSKKVWWVRLYVMVHYELIVFHQSSRVA